ncbi:hypothetical protein AURDEDRAFT_109491 [Auricularia subglabra TFB-10046 SS5]|nr:hypothetical protein AURDEDRAFT_109491 [Auricularia subglabra TFB-10046 SS5]
MPTTSASESSYSTPATSTSTPDASHVMNAHIALAVVLGVIGLALCITVGILVARQTQRRRRLRRGDPETPSAPVEGVKTPADAWASMATFEAALCAPEKAVLRQDPPIVQVGGKGAASRRSSVPQIQIRVTTSSSWVIEQDLSELWVAARRDASAPEEQRDSVLSDLAAVDETKGRA